MSSSWQRRTARRCRPSAGTRPCCRRRDPPSTAPTIPAATRPTSLIDALLGIGAARFRRCDGGGDRAHRALRRRGARVLAIDVPRASTRIAGQPLGPHCVVAADTLTMLTLKPGLFTAAGRDHAGRAWLARLGGDSEGEARGCPARRSRRSVVRLAARRTRSTRAASATSPSLVAPPAWLARPGSRRAPPTPRARGESLSTSSATTAPPHPRVSIRACPS
jgi:hypothetical protein